MMGTIGTVLIFFTLFVCLIFNIFDGSAMIQSVEQSCTKIGMEYYTSMDSTFCIDKYNKAHYVKIECESVGFMKYDCNPRLISVGDVRTIKVGE